LYGPGGLIQSIQTASSSTTAIQYFNNINIIPGTYQATVTLERRPCVGSWYNSETVVTNLITVTNSTAALPVLNADFNLTAVSLAGTPNYKVAATGVTNTGTNPYAHFGFSWNIVEVSLTNGATIPGTEVDNSSNWWGASQIPTTTFIGYNGTSTVSGNGNGIFKLGHKYRITRGVWEDCRGWSSVSKMVYICSTCRTNNTNPILVEESMADSELQTIQINSMMTDQNKLILPTVASEARFAVYPNPTTGEITVQHTVNTKWLQVHDLMGKSLLEQTPNGSTQTTFDLSSLTSGIYLLCADGEVPQKIVKQ
jgi:hypothetical protein